MSVIGRHWFQPQELVGATSWGFKSPLPHQPSLANERVSYGWQAARRLSTVARSAKADNAYHPALMLASSREVRLASKRSCRRFVWQVNASPPTFRQAIAI